MLHCLPVQPWSRLFSNPLLFSPEPTQSRPPWYGQLSGQQQQQSPLTGPLDSARMASCCPKPDKSCLLALGHCLRSIPEGWNRSRSYCARLEWRIVREGPCFCKAQLSFLVDISSSPGKLSSHLFCAICLIWDFIWFMMIFFFFKKKIAFIKLA